MAITVKHSADPIAAGSIAYAGARSQGIRDRSVQDREHQLRVEQQKLSERRLEEQKKEQTRSREFAREQTQQKFEQNKELANINQDLQKQGAVFEDQLKRDFVEFEFTAGQKKKYEGLAQALDYISDSDDYSPEEKAVLRRDIQSKMLGMAPLPKLKEKEPAIGGHKPGEIWQQDGLMLTLDKDGIPKKIGEANHVTNKDRIDAWTLALQQSQTLDGDKKVTDLKKAEEIYQRIMKETSSEPGNTDPATSASEIEFVPVGGIDPPPFDILAPQAQMRVAEEWNKRANQLAVLNQELAAVKEKYTKMREEFSKRRVADVSGRIVFAPADKATFKIWMEKENQLIQQQSKIVKQLQEISSLKQLPRGE